MNKITVGVEQFNVAVQAVKKSLAKVTTLPVLSNIHINVSGSKLILTTTDITSMSSAIIDLGTPFPMDDFSVLADGDKLLKFVESLDGGNITLESDPDNKQLVVRWKGRRATLQTMPVNEYPKIDFGDPSHLLEISPENFGEIIKSVSAFYLNDNSARVYTGIELIVSDEGIRASATDTFSGATIQYGNVENNAVKLIALGDQIKEIAKILAKSDELSIGISDDGKKVFLFGVFGNVSVKYITQALASDDFVDLYAYIRNTLISSNFFSVLHVSEVLSAIRPLDAYDSHLMKITMADGRVLLDMNDEYSGSYHAEVPTIESSQNEYSFYIDRKRMTSALKSISFEFVKLSTGDKMPLLIIQPNVDEGSEYKYYQGVGKMNLQ